MSDEKKPLTLSEAIEIALEYENNVRDLYVESASKATEEVGERIFNRLAREEQGHVNYLTARQKEWEQTGKINIVPVGTLLPTRERLTAGLATLESKVETYDWTLEIELLKKARAAEAETGAFYKRMVAELDEEGRNLFREFLEIEDAHYDLVQLQLEALEGGGFWFDCMEFSLEGA